MKTLPDSSFFNRNTSTVARSLLGMTLLSRIGRRLTGGIIVETEAYLATGDPACHGTRGKTRSNAAMFGDSGKAYVYPIHAGFCFNIVTGRKNEPSAVLVRAITPLIGVRTMQERRGVLDLRRLTRGPSCLCQALAIDRGMDHWDLLKGSRLWIQETNPAQAVDNRICQTVRIGVTSAKTERLRFAVADNPYVSGPKRLRQMESGEL